MVDQPIGYKLFDTLREGRNRPDNVNRYMVTVDISVV